MVAAAPAVRLPLPTHMHRHPRDWSFPGSSGCRPQGELYVTEEGFGSDEDLCIGPVARSCARSGLSTARATPRAADLAALETQLNADGREAAEESDDPLNSNPYGVARDEASQRWVVADAGGSLRIVIDDAREAAPLTALPDADTDLGPAQDVPTAVVVCPDGAYYTGGLAGDVPGTVSIHRVDPRRAIGPNSPPPLRRRVVGIRELDLRISGPTGSPLGTVLSDTGQHGIALEARKGSFR